MKGRCLPYGEGVTYWPLAEILKGTPASSTPTRTTRRCEDRTTRRGRPRRLRSRASGRRARVHVRPRGRALRLRRSPPRQVRLETHEAWRAFFTGLAAERPGDRGGRGHPLGRRRSSRPARGARRQCCGAAPVPVSGTPDLVQTTPVVGWREAQLLLDLPRAAGRTTTPRGSSSSCSPSRSFRVGPRGHAGSAPRGTRSSSRRSSDT